MCNSSPNRWALNADSCHLADACADPATLPLAFPVLPSSLRLRAPSLSSLLRLLEPVSSFSPVMPSGFPLPRGYLLSLPCADCPRGRIRTSATGRSVSLDKTPTTTSPPGIFHSPPTTVLSWGASSRDCGRVHTFLPPLLPPDFLILLSTSRSTWPLAQIDLWQVFAEIYLCHPLAGVLKGPQWRNSTVCSLSFMELMPLFHYCPLAFYLLILPCWKKIV